MSKEIILEDKAELNGQEYTVLNMRKPRMRDLKGVRHIKDPADQDAALFGNLCDVAPAVIEELTVVDYNSVAEAYRELSIPKQKS
ncbi:phage tail assembly protein [Kiloniella litopenaei]|uniref:phage tail assembly protein n=1 Tax=Kiloniella litopenaei TaxID=1549748 RepID=UPI003BAA7264